MAFIRQHLVAPACTGCPLDRDGIRVPPAGETTADVVLVGEGPGHNEERERIPFIGDAGHLLDELLRRCKGPARSTLWITNAALCRPRFVEFDEDSWYSRTETLQESTQKYCRGRLFAELAIVKPRVVLVIGAYALKSLTGLEGVQKYHGALVPTDINGHKCIVIPMLHPAALLRGESRQAQTVIDVMTKAFDIARNGVRPPGTLLTVSPYHPRGEEQVIAELEALVDTIIDRGYDISLDVETDMEEARHATLTVFGFGCEALKIGCAVSVLAWNRETQTYNRCWTARAWQRLWAILARLLRGRCKKWLWNMNFDLTVLRRYWGSMVQGPFDDGMHWHWLAQPDSHHNLAWACQTHQHIRPWKAMFWDLEKSGRATDRDLLIYNAEDCLYTAMETPHLQRMVRERRNDHLADHQVRVTNLAYKAYHVGIPVDRGAIAEARKDYVAVRDKAYGHIREEIKPHLQDLNEYVHEMRCERKRVSAMERGVEYEEPARWHLEAKDWNHNSEYMARWFLYEHLRLPVTRMTKGGEEGKNPQPSYSYKAVLDHMSQHIVKDFIDCGEYSYRLQRLDEMIATIDADDRLHIAWNTTGQAGTRWRSSPNVQNLDKKLKKVLRAPPGWCWVGADAAQLEMRILAALAGVGRMVEIFNKAPFDEKAERWKKFDPAWDSHALVATLVYGDLFLNASMEEKDKLRTLVKRVVYGMNYGAYPKKIRQSLLEDKRLSTDLRARLSLETVETIHRGFFAYLPEVGQWAEAEIEKVRRTGVQVIPPFSRRRYWPTSIIEEPKIRNTPIQVAAGDIVNWLFCNMDDQMVEEQLQAYMVLHGHDACYWLTRQDHAPRVQHIVNEHFHFYLKGRMPVHIHGQATTGPTAADVA
jgi:DNA polymerase